MGLTVTVLGSHGSYPGVGGACSGYLVQGAGTTVWVDSGSGTLANLQSHVSLADVDAIVLSHEHPDHWTDLESVWVAGKYIFDLPTVPVYAPEGLRSHSYHDNQNPYFTWHDIADGDRIDIGGLSFTFSNTDHGPLTLAMRIDGEGRSFGYSSDTAPGWSLEALGPGIDLALCEATLPTEMEGKSKHLSARQAGITARDAAVERLVITHIWPTLDWSRSQAEAAETFGKPVEVAELHARFLV